MPVYWDRLLLWIVGLSPFAAMITTIAATNWVRLRTFMRRRLLAGLAIAVAAAAFIIWDLKHDHYGVISHVHVREPKLLLLVIPLLALLTFLQLKSLSGISRGRMWSAFILRATIFNLLILALAGLEMVVERDALSVLFAVDVSKSVPVSEQQRAVDFICKSVQTKKANDEAGLMIFGGSAALEVSPSATFATPEARNFRTTVDRDATDISKAMRMSLSHLSGSSRRRVVLFTDGGQTDGDAAEELKHVVSMGSDVWVVPFTRSDSAEMLIDKIVIPNELMWEQPFDAHVFVYSNISARARVRLYPGDKVGQSSYEQVVNLVPGKNRVTFSGLRMHSGGAKEVRAVLEPMHTEDDTLSENNEAYAFTDVQTENRVLVLTSDLSEVKYLLAALEDQKMSIDVRSGTTLPDNPEAYRAYDCIVLANLARGFLSEQQMSVIQSCVEDQGAGLVMIGGDQSFGAGGYLGTPIEKVLPVDMDLQNQRVMPSGALSMIIETCEVPDGDMWGKKICKAAIKTLSPQDYAGLLYYNNMGDTWSFKPTLIGNRTPYLFSLIDNVQTGDIPQLDSILSMAVTAMANLKNVSLKHIVVIGDGDWAPASAATVKAARDAKITISALSVYPHNGQHIASMKELAVAGGGRYYAVDDAKRLPQIFVK